MSESLGGGQRNEGELIKVGENEGSLNKLLFTVHDGNILSDIKKQTEYWIFQWGVMFGLTCCNVV